MPYRIVKDREDFLKNEWRIRRPEVRKARVWKALAEAVINPGCVQVVRSRDCSPVILKQIANDLIEDLHILKIEAYIYRETLHVKCTNFGVLDEDETNPKMHGFHADRIYLDELQADC